jgi:hypothetical protein
VTSVLLLRGLEGGPDERRPLDARKEEALASVTGELVSFAVSPDQGAIAHERDGQITAAWNRDGALRLAELLPPAFAELASAIRERYQRSQ